MVATASKVSSASTASTFSQMPRVSLTSHHTGSPAFTGRTRPHRPGDGVVMPTLIIEGLGTVMVVPIWRSAPPIRNLGQPARASASNSTRPRRKPSTYTVGARARRHAPGCRVEAPTNERPAPTTSIDLEIVPPQTSSAIDDGSVPVAKASTSKRFGRRRPCAPFDVQRPPTGR